MSTQWYYTKNGQRQGPINSKTLKQLANSGEVEPEEYVWKAGMTEWRTAKQVKGLFSADNTPEIAPPPVQTSPEPDSPALGKAAKDLMVALTAQTKKTGGQAIQAANDWRQKRAEANPVEPPAPAARRPRRRKRRSKLVFIIGAIGLFVMLFMCSGLFNPQDDWIKLGPSIFGNSTASYTVDELREEIGDKSYRPKSKFYKEFGRPYRISEYSDDTYLYYQCKDGIARIECSQAAFQFDDEIVPFSVDQAR